MRKIGPTLAVIMSALAVSGTAQDLPTSPGTVSAPRLITGSSLERSQFDWRPSNIVHSSLYAPRFGTQNSSGEDSATRSKPTSASSGFGATRWFGVALLAGGGAMIAHGAMISDPCSGFNGTGVICASNYQAVRTTYMTVGGSTAGLGLLLLFVHRH